MDNRLAFALGRGYAIAMDAAQVKETPRGFYAYEAGNHSGVGPFKTRQEAERWIKTHVPPEGREKADPDYGFHVATHRQPDPGEVVSPRNAMKKYSFGGEFYPSVASGKFRGSRR